MRSIQVLYWEGCPSHPEALALLRDVLVEHGIVAEPALIEVRTQEQAEALGFVGSPTILVDGRDVDAEGAARSRPSLTCRVYTDEAGAVTPIPSRSQLERALVPLGATR